MIFEDEKPFLEWKKEDNFLTHSLKQHVGANFYLQIYIAERKLNLLID